MHREITQPEQQIKNLDLLFAQTFQFHQINIIDM